MLQRGDVWTGAFSQFLPTQNLFGVISTLVWFCCLFDVVRSPFPWWVALWMDHFTRLASVRTRAHARLTLLFFYIPLLFKLLRPAFTGPKSWRWNPRQSLPSWLERRRLVSPALVANSMLAVGTGLALAQSLAVLLPSVQWCISHTQRWCVCVYACMCVCVCVCM